MNNRISNIGLKMLNETTGMKHYPNFSLRVTEKNGFISVWLDERSQTADTVCITMDASLEFVKSLIKTFNLIN